MGQWYVTESGKGGYPKPMRSKRFAQASSLGMSVTKNVCSKGKPPAEAGQAGWRVASQTLRCKCISIETINISIQFEFQGTWLLQCRKSSPRQFQAVESRKVNSNEELERECRSSNKGPGRECRRIGTKSI